MPNAVAEEQVWLRAHGISDGNETDAIEIDPVESIKLDTDVSRGAWVGLFRYELRPTTDTDVEIALQRSRFSREDLMSFWREASQEKKDALTDHLTNFADRELWLLSRLGSIMKARLPEDPIERITEARAQFEHRVQNLLPGDIERLAVFDGEKWTTRKVLRQFVVGERELLNRIKVLAGEGARTAKS